jgi:hypothetical protein
MTPRPLNIYSTGGQLTSFILSLETSWDVATLLLLWLKMKKKNGMVRSGAGLLAKAKDPSLSGTGGNTMTRAVPSFLN